MQKWSWGKDHREQINQDFTAIVQTSRQRVLSYGSEEEAISMSLLYDSQLKYAKSLSI